jgi:hypothetical protein
MMIGSTLLLPALVGAAPQQTTSSQPASPQPAASAPATNRGVVNATNRNQVATRPGAVVSTRSITEARGNGATVPGSGNVAGTTASGLATDQRAALRQQLAGMDARLNQLMATMNSSTGAQRGEAVAVVVRELASQLSAMRQALLASDLGSLDVAGNDGPTIFITPSGSVQAQERRVNGLEQPTTSASAPTADTQVGQSSTSGMTMQAQSRRSGDPAEPATTP